MASSEPTGSFFNCDWILSELKEAAERPVIRLFLPAVFAEAAFRRSWRPARNSGVDLTTVCRSWIA